MATITFTIAPEAGCLRIAEEIREAIAYWRRGLAAASSSRQIAFCKNNIAFAEVVMNDPASFGEAEAYSAAAYGAHPEVPAFTGTRGAALVRVGRAAEALPLLRRALKGNEAARSQAYNKASLASALAALGRTAEARRELDEARRLNPACELLGPAEADLAAAPADAAGESPLPAPESRWETWGGLPRWQQIARIMAFCYTIVPYHGADIGIAPILVSVIVLLSPELTGVLALGVSSLWIAVVQRPGASTSAMTAAFGVVAVALAAVRPRLGPAPRSKVPSVVVWALGIVAVLSTLGSPLMRLMSFARHGIKPTSPLSFRSFRPGQTAALALVGWATALLLSRRRWVRPLAIVPVAAALIAAAGPRVHSQLPIDLARIPVDGAPIVWSAPRPAMVLRSARFAGDDFASRTTLSPGGRAWLSPVTDVHPGTKPRRLVRVRDFEGHVAETEALDGAFVDDEHVVLVRVAGSGKGRVRVSEAPLFSLFVALWSRDVPELDDASVEVESGGRAVWVRGDAKHEGEVAVRLVLGAETPAEVFRMPSKYPDADFPVGISRALEGEVMGVVSRERAAGPKTDGAPAPFASFDLRDEESHDLELWVLRSGAESLLAAHLPHPTCLHPAFGHPALWCTIGWSSDRALLKIDPVDGRVARVHGALPPMAHAALLGPSKLAVLSDDRLGVVDLDARRGSWLTLPREEAPARTRRFQTELTPGGLGVVRRTGHDEATVTVYAPP